MKNDEKLTFFRSCRKAYEQLVENAIKEADEYMDRDGVPKENRDYSPCICDAEGDANAKEVIGYYLVNIDGDMTPYEHWHENTDYLFESGKATEQDKEVEKALLYLQKNPELLESCVKDNQGITKEQIKAGYEQGIIKLDKCPNDDSVVCRIEDYWFYFGGREAEDSTVEEYQKNVPEEDIVSEIYDTLCDFVTESPDEYAYYAAVLEENGL